MLEGCAADETWKRPEVRWKVLLSKVVPLDKALAAQSFFLPALQPLAAVLRKRSFPTRGGYILEGG